jgi:hypothetical protein
MSVGISTTLERGSTDTAAGTTGILFTDQRQFYVNPFQYAELWQAATPFISAMIQKARVITNLPDPIFKMFQHEEPWAKQEAVIATIANSGVITNNDTGVAITLTSVTGLPSITSDALVNMQFEIWNAAKTIKRGVVFITANSSGTYTAKTCKAADVGTTAVPVIATDIMVAIGTAYGEGSEAGEAWADDLKVVYGSTGIHRTPVEVTGTLYQASLRGANKDLSRLRMQKLYNHKILENKRLLRSVNLMGTNLTASDTWADATRAGAANGTQTTGGRVRMPYGLIPMIEDYGYSTESLDYQTIFDRSGGYEWNQFVDDSEKTHQYVNFDGTRDWFCGPKAFSFWSKLDGTAGGSESKLKNGIKVSGMMNSSGGVGYNFRWLEGPFGMDRLILDPSLRNEYSNYMISPSWNNIYYAVYRPFVWKTAIKDDKFNGFDGIKDEYFNDTGVGATLIKSHALIKLPVA